MKSQTRQSGNHHSSQSKKKCSPSSYENTPAKEISPPQIPYYSGILSESNRTVLQKPSPVKTTLHNTPLTPSVFLHEGNMLQAIYTEVNELKSDVKILKTTLTTKETDKIIEDLIPNPIAAEGDLNALKRKIG
nr:uncharacterized protein LOC123753128 [Procambarus clarkii]